MNGRNANAAIWKSFVVVGTNNMKSNQFSLIAFFCLTILACLSLAGCAKKNELPGKLTIGSYEVPAELIETASAKKKPIRWTTPNFDVTPIDSPYKLVMIFDGQAEGEFQLAEATFEVVWNIKQDNQSGGPMQFAAIDPATMKPLKNSQTVKAIAVSPPLSFKDPDRVSIEITQKGRLTGLKLDKLTLVVRSGMDAYNWKEILFSLPLVGLVFLFLVWRFRN